MKTIFRFIMGNPLSVSLFLFNTGIFAWLQTTSTTILTNLNLQENLTQYIPAPILVFTGNSLSAVPAFVGNTAWAWLIFSMMILIVINFIKGLIKFIFVTVVLVVGLYLIWQNQEMIRGLIGG